MSTMLETKAMAAVQPRFYSINMTKGLDLSQENKIVRESLEQSDLNSTFEYCDSDAKQQCDTNIALQHRVGELNEMLSRACSLHHDEVAARKLVSGRFDELLNVLPAGIVLLDVKGRVSECNLAAKELLGEPLKGELWLDIIQRSFSPRMDDGHEVSLKDGRRVGLVTRSLETEPGQLIVLTDMTQTRALQERLSRHQRLSALGKMVASLAHQIRTPLSAAMLYGEHLANPALEPEMQQRFAAKLNSRLNNLEQQIRDMLVFAKGNMPLSDLVGSQQLVAGMEAGMEALLNRTNIRCSISNDAPEVTLRCNQEALIGAILNLVNNAIEAVEGDARISIQLQQQEAILLIRVKDNGPGIDKALQKKIMEPFFTTKSQGTGLGMSVVQAVVTAHQGEFSIFSTTGQGTEITLKLPVNT